MSDLGAQIKIEKKLKKGSIEIKVVQTGEVVIYGYLSRYDVKNLKEQIEYLKGIKVELPKLVDELLDKGTEELNKQTEWLSQFGTKRKLLK